MLRAGAGGNVRGQMTAAVTPILKNDRPALYSVGPETTAFDAVARMAQHGIAAVLVLEDGKLRGVFSAKDYFNRLVLNANHGSDVPVREVMTRVIVTVQSSTTVPDCMQIMTTKGIRHLPIVDDDELVGLVTLADLVRYQLADNQSQIDQLIHYIGR